MKKSLLGVLVFAAALAPAACLAWQARDLPHLGQTYDDAIYWLSGRSIALGQGYRLPYLQGQPAQTLLPPGYPLVLALAWRLQSLWPSWLMFPALLLLADRLAVRWGAGTVRRIVLALWMGWNPMFVYFSYTLLSELMFACLLIACLLLAMRAFQPGATAAWALLAGLAGAAAYLTRSAGLILLPVLPLCFGVQRMARKAGLFLTGMLPAVAAWQIWAGLHRHDPGAEGYRTYLSYFSEMSPGDWWTVAGANIQLILVHTGGLLLYSLDGIGPAIAAMALGAGAWAVFLYTATRNARAPGLAPSAIVAGYLCLLIVWPFPTSPRLLLPAVPLLLTGLCCWLPSGWLRSPAVLVLLTLAGVFNIVTAWGAFTIVQPGILAENRRRVEQNQPVYRWLQANCGERFLVSRNPPEAFLRSGCRGAGPVSPAQAWYQGGERLESEENRRLLELARDRGNYLLLECSEAGQLADPPCGMPSDLWNTLPLRLAAVAPRARLYRVERDP